MQMIWIYLALWLLSFGVLSDGSSSNSSPRPAQVTIGAILTFNSTIGRVAKVAIEAAVKDINSNSSVLQGTKLVVNLQDSNCNGFLGTVEALQFLKNDTIAIIGPQSSVVAQTISYVASNLHVPLLSFSATDPTLSSFQYPYFVRTTHSDFYQMNAIADIVTNYGWAEVIAIYIDDDYGRNGVIALDDALTARNCKISYKAGIPLTSGTKWDHIRDILEKVPGIESKVIVLHAYPDVGFGVFSAAQSLGIMGDGYVWIATDWLSSVLDSSLSLPSSKSESMQGILVLRQHTLDSDQKKAFTSKFNDLSGGSFKLNSYALHAYDTVWLFAHAMDYFLEQGGNISFSDYPNSSAVEGNNLRLEAMSIFDGGERLLKNIMQSDFTGLAGQVKFDSDRSLTQPAYDIMNVLGTGFRRIGYWSNYSGLSTDPPEALYSRPSNRSHANQKLYSVIWPGETSITPRGWVSPNNGDRLRIGVPRRVSYREFVSQAAEADVFKGFCIDVFTSALKLLPHTVPYVFVPFGDGINNPSYDDIVNSIASGELDGAVGDIAITRNRSKLVDFTQPYVSSGLVVVAPFLKVHTGSWAFLHPFTPKTWGVIAFFVVFIGTSMWALEHRVNDEFRGPPRKQAVTILWFGISSFFMSHRENILGTLGRVVMITWLFLVLVLNSSYTANLTAFLTLQQLYSPIRGIDSLKHGNERIGYQVGSFVENILIEIGIEKSRLVALNSPEEYARELLRGPKKGGVVAVVDELAYMQVFLSSHCKFEIVGEQFTKSSWGFAFPRESPLSGAFTSALLSLSENGDIQRIHDKWLTTTSCSTASTELASDILPLKSYAGLFLVCGIATAFAVFLYYLRISSTNLRGEGGNVVQPELEPEPEPKPDQTCGRNSYNKRLRKFICQSGEKKDNNDENSSGDTKRRKMSLSM